ncbi:hypothetical protein SAMN04487770_10698 [Butyrivibrio sp. ob235]|uniref:hypothetical protein n=1 Tax=Butyrivibrio sp. ob235 TaxID=1761780 RepID=UPI0008D62DAC|nr:hypothetical protein [Butyrivibrio sp. ob235]SEL14069.1 hypothetical protein SAMN04487770_10698 [Butyrivibrio sp. ob235]
MHISNNYHTIPIMSYCGKNTSIPQNLTTRANMPALVSTDPATQKEAVIPIAYKDGSRMSTFRADSYSQDNPIYTVKYWDGNGNYKEEEIDGSKVDPSNASVLELLAFGSYCADRGYPEDAVSNVMMAMVGVDEEPKFYSLDEALEKHNFTERMKDCVDITNNPAYMIVHLKYKAMYEFMLERSAENGGLKKEQE